ncbi:MAG: succinate dehydrogenase assembly factor 2 [Pseudohongiellaceae bacterium]
MLTDIDYKKLVWHSRRGMLELDLLLLPFARERVPALPFEQQQSYIRLLEEEDQDLFAWLVDRQQHPDAGQQGLIAEIRDHAADTRRKA